MEMLWGQVQKEIIMATSGTYVFNLDLADAMEEAFEKAGRELRTGYDYKTARRSLNLLMLEWQNRGLNKLLTISLLMS